MDNDGNPYPVQVTMVRWQVQEYVRGKLNWVFMSDDFNDTADYLYSQFKASADSFGGRYQTTFRGDGHEHAPPQTFSWDFHNWTLTHYGTEHVKSFRKISYVVMEGPQ
jgi:hypothetical protein